MRPPIKWTLEACQAEACRFNSRSCWGKGHPTSYSAAQKRGWLDLCCGHMKRAYIQHTLEECKASAAKFTRRVDWQRDSIHNRYYAAALHHGWLNRCCRHMSAILDNREVTYQVYAIVFAANRAYVGVTRNRLDIRLRSHFSKNGRFFEMSGEVAYAWSICENLAPSEAAKHEQRWIDAFKKAAYGVLNIAAAGSLGPETEPKSIVIERSRESALKYRSRTEWRLSDPRNFYHAYRLGIVPELCQHMKREPRYPLESCLEKARLCKTYAEFASKYRRHYKAAWHNGWLDKLGLKRKARRFPKSKDEFVTAVARYTTKQELRKADPSLTCKGYKHGWMTGLFAA